MKIAIVSDAWFPQINGVVRTLKATSDQLAAWGHEVTIIGPEHFFSLPCPTYPEIQLALPGFKLQKMLDEIQPDAIHIPTEGTLGFAARAYCLENRRPFITSFHTRYPDYLQPRLGLPFSWTYAYLRWFHRPATRVLVPTPSMAAELTAQGFINLAPWTRGVDTDLFRPRAEVTLPYPKPIFLYVGRLSLEKSIDDFLALDLPGTKLVVGDGPEAPRLKQQFPQAVFVGSKSGEALAAYYAGSDVFVFPSRSDTFGLVVLEALASGLPVVARPGIGPADTIGTSGTGIISHDLGNAAMQALRIDRAACRNHALTFSWATSTQQYLAQIASIVKPSVAAAA